MHQKAIRDSDQISDVKQRRTIPARFKGKIVRVIIDPRIPNIAGHLQKGLEVDPEMTATVIVRGEPRREILVRELELLPPEDPRPSSVPPPD